MTSVAPMSSNPPAHDFDKTLSSLMGLGLGLMFIAGGLWVQRLQAHEQATLTETQGVVVDTVVGRHYDQTDKSEEITYAPVIEFRVRDQPMRFTGRYESYRSSQGTKVVVRYNPDQPETTAQVVDPLEGLTAWGMFGVGGVAAIASLIDLLPTWLRGIR